MVAAVSRSRRGFSPALRATVAGTLLLLAVVLGGGKPVGVWQDGVNYEVLFGAAAEAPWYELLVGSDPAYSLLSRMVSTVGGNLIFLAVIVAMFACGLKYAALRHIDTDRAVVIAVYLSYLFWLHEYTQIRLSLALAFVLYAIYARPKQRWLFFVLGMATHLSTALVVSLYFALRERRKALLVAIAIIPVAAALATRWPDELMTLLARATLYATLHEEGEFTDINAWSLMPISQAVLLAICLPHLRRLGADARTEFQLACVGLASFYALMFLPVLAFRVHELFIPFLIVLVSRVWRSSLAVRFALVPYMAFGLRSSFVGPSSLLAIFGT